MKNTPSSSSDTRFEKTLQELKEYILSLLWKRRPLQKKPDVSPAPPPLPPPVSPEKKSWFDKISEKLKGTLEDLWLSDDTNTPPRNPPKTPNIQESAPDLQDQYDPQDSEFTNAQWESPRFAEISPSYSGYYSQEERNIFDLSNNKWNIDRNLTPYTGWVTQGKIYSYAINLKKWLKPIPLPEWSVIDMSKLYYSGGTAPIFLADQDGCIYVQCRLAHQQMSFPFSVGKSTHTTYPGVSDSEKMIVDDISPETRTLLAQCQGRSPQEIATLIRAYILRTKKYSTKVQGTLHKKSNARNYITNLDRSPILECYSANTLFVALMRELGVPARIVLGHMAQGVSKEWASLLSSSNGHAWSKIWNGSEWIRYDATPTIKEDGSKSEQNMDGSESGQDSWEGNIDPSWDQNWDTGGSWQPGDTESTSGSSGEKSWDESSSGETEWSSEWKNSWKSEKGKAEKDGKNGKSSSWKSEASWEPGKSPKDLLDEMIQKVKDDSLASQAEQMKDTIEKLEKAKSKEDIRKVLDASGLDGFAKDEIDQIGNTEIFDQEKKDLDALRASGDEEKLDTALQDSLLDEDYQKKLWEYAREIRKAIQEAKSRLKSEMDRMGFSEREMGLYRAYKDLEKELEGEVRRQIQALERILPPKYKIESNDQRYRSGTILASTWALVDHALTGDPNVFRRTKEVKDPTEINMYETIIIDRSGSMGKFTSPGSALRESVKAGIIRAKVLEHFKVDFSLLFFDDAVESVMDFWEKFSERRKCSVPSKLMRALDKSWGTNISAPLTYTWDAMKQERKKKWGSHFGNITFIGDGEPQSGLTGPPLTGLIDQMRKDGFGVTAYYIGWWRKDELEWYFWKAETGWTIIVPNIAELTPALITSYNTWLKKTLRRFVR